MIVVNVSFAAQEHILLRQLPLCVLGAAQGLFLGREHLNVQFAILATWRLLVLNLVKCAYLAHTPLVEQEVVSVVKAVSFRLPLVQSIEALVFLAV